MLWALFFFTEFVCLFFLSQLLTKVLSSFLLAITRSQKTTIYILSFLFFPGVLVHELAHLLFANILFVKTGEIEFFPQVQGNYVKLGSVAIAKSDPIRRFVIGVAPVIAGSLLIFGLFWYLAQDFPGPNWQTMVLVYAFFEIGNTMFSSKKDMEGAIALLLTILLLGAGLYFIGLRVSFPIAKYISSPAAVFFFQKMDTLLLVPILVNIIVYLPMEFLLHRR